MNTFDRRGRAYPSEEKGCREQKRQQPQREGSKDNIGVNALKPVLYYHCGGGRTRTLCSLKALFDRVTNPACYRAPPPLLAVCDKRTYIVLIPPSTRFVFRNDPHLTLRAHTYQETRSQSGDISIVDPLLVQFQPGGGQDLAAWVSFFNGTDRLIDLERRTLEALLRV